MSPRLISLCLALALLPCSLFAETRRALLIGNADYGDQSLNLANPANDAAKMEEALKTLGFATTLKVDLDLPTMEEEVRQFMNQIVAGDTVFFFYAGHGLQVDGQNYLLPRAASIASATDVKYKAYDAQRLIEELDDRKAGLKILVLDCCRDNPLSRSVRSARAGNGLARLEAVEGTIIAYSTAPGKTAADGTGSNSPYTAALAEVLATTPEEGLEIIAAFRIASAKVKAATGQIPWVNFDSSLTSYFLRPPARLKIDTPPPPPVPVAIGKPLTALTVEGRETRLLRVANVGNLYKEHPDLNAAQERVRRESDAVVVRLQEKVGLMKESMNLLEAAMKASVDPALDSARRQEEKAKAGRLSAELSVLEQELNDFQKSERDRLQLLNQQETASLLAKVHSSLLSQYSGSGLLIDSTSPADLMPPVLGEHDLAQPPKVLAVRLRTVSPEHPGYAENAAAIEKMETQMQEDLASRQALVKTLSDKPDRTRLEDEELGSLIRDVNEYEQRRRLQTKYEVAKLRAALIEDIVAAAEKLRKDSGADLVVNADSSDFAGRPFWIVGPSIPDATAALLMRVKGGTADTVSPVTARLGVVTLEGAKLPENGDDDAIEKTLSEHVRQLIAQLQPALVGNQLDLVACMSAEIHPGQRFVISATAVPQIFP